MKKFLTILLFMICGLAFGAEAVPGQGIADKIMEILTGVGGASATIAVVLEFVFRLIPSKKPLSLLHAAAGVLSILDWWLQKLSAIVKKLAEILDKVLPQKVK